MSAMEFGKFARMCLFCGHMKTLSMDGDGFCDKVKDRTKAVDKKECFTYYKEMA